MFSLRLSAISIRKCYSRIITNGHYRVNLAIAYLVYLRCLPDMHYAHAALRESISLLRKGFPCWIADLNWVISHLPGSDVYETHVEDMDGG